MTIHTRSIAVKHNIEVAHRLYQTVGKCENIHGHSMWVTMHIRGDLDSKGMLAGIEYGDLKHMFRQYLDERYDHHLLLNAADPWAHPIWKIGERNDEGNYELEPDQNFLPGLTTLLKDPTTENIAEEIALDMSGAVWERWKDSGQLFDLKVEVWETSVNMAAVTTGFEGFRAD